MKNLYLLTLIILVHISFISCNVESKHGLDLNNFTYQPDLSHIDNDFVVSLKEEVLKVHKELNKWYGKANRGIRCRQDDGQWSGGAWWDKSETEKEAIILNYIKGTLQDSIKNCDLIREPLKEQCIKFCKSVDEAYNLAGIISQDKGLNHLYGIFDDDPQAFWEYMWYEYRDSDYMVEENQDPPVVDPKVARNCLLEMVTLTGKSSAIVAFPGYFLTGFSPGTYIFLFEKEAGKWLLSGLYLGSESGE